MEYFARKKKDIPAPNAYKLGCDWTKNPKGKFFKSKRITMIDEILKEKKNKPPGPGSYKLPNFKIASVPKSTTDKC